MLTKREITQMNRDSETRLVAFTVQRIYREYQNTGYNLHDQATMRTMYARVLREAARRILADDDCASAQPPTLEIRTA